ncbi:MAG: hypothetical protein JWO32_1444, partial [Bacteroidetes bacterium]|nr:hypothetical protein [Bacteroidota bacterium]
MPLHKPSIDVTVYTAFGDSITAGYTDGALYYSGQQNSYANLLAAQFKLIGGGSFKQPLVNPDSAGISFSGNSRLVLKQESNSSKTTVPYLDYLAPSGDSSIFASNSYSTQGPFNNFGVPGAKALSLAVAGYGNPANGAGNYNPFFTRMAARPELSS